ncbi:hypothetical protein [Streptomyces griseoviridis]|uniref:hypothetical protein n=1 Tax=Streptomyces griseoviridis TaxID=45398 RepID=UPI0034162A3C
MVVAENAPPVGERRLEPGRGAFRAARVRAELGEVVPDDGRLGVFRTPESGPCG